MHRLSPEPACFKRFRAIGGALDFAVFDDADGEIETAIAAMHELVPLLDADALRAIGFRKLSRKGFFGDHFDLDRGLLLEQEFDAARGYYWRALRDESSTLTGGLLPERGSGGNFAYAFTRHHIRYAQLVRKCNRCLIKF
ncbi:MAG TPA: hypothetical protein PKY87_09025 [Terricaulis sp.]|nr:hypothetical protein [Terricaulis sp.]